METNQFRKKQRYTISLASTFIGLVAFAASPAFAESTQLVTSATLYEMPQNWADIEKNCAYHLEIVKNFDPKNSVPEGCQKLTDVIYRVALKGLDACEYSYHNTVRSDMIESMWKTMHDEKLQCPSEVAQRSLACSAVCGSLLSDTIPIIVNESTKPMNRSLAIYQGGEDPDTHQKIDSVMSEIAKYAPTCQRFRTEEAKKMIDRLAAELKATQLQVTFYRKRWENPGAKFANPNIKRDLGIDTDMVDIPAPVQHYLQGPTRVGSLFSESTDTSVGGESSFTGVSGTRTAGVQSSQVRKAEGQSQAQVQNTPNQIQNNSTLLANSGSTTAQGSDTTLPEGVTPGGKTKDGDTVFLYKNPHDPNSTELVVVPKDGSPAKAYFITPDDMKLCSQDRSKIDQVVNKAKANSVDMHVTDDKLIDAAKKDLPNAQALAKAQEHAQDQAQGQAQSQSTTSGTIANGSGSGNNTNDSSTPNSGQGTSSAATAGSKPAVKVAAHKARPQAQISAGNGTGSQTPKTTQSSDPNIARVTKDGHDFFAINQGDKSYFGEGRKNAAGKLVPEKLFEMPKGFADGYKEAAVLNTLPEVIGAKISNGDQEVKLDSEAGKAVIAALNKKPVVASHSTTKTKSASGEKHRALASTHESKASKGTAVKSEPSGRTKVSFTYETESYTLTPVIPQGYMIQKTSRMSDGKLKAEGYVTKPDAQTVQQLQANPSQLKGHFENAQKGYASSQSKAYFSSIVDPGTSDEEIARIILKGMRDNKPSDF